MNKEFLKKIKARLNAEKKQLERQLGELGGKGDSSKEGVEWTEIGSKDDENAAEVASYDEKLSLEKNLRNSLEEVNIALDNIQKGTYGTCSNCGKNIQEKRLEIFPAATQCIECRSS